jgi:hypothetical protein
MVTESPGPQAVEWGASLEAGRIRAREWYHKRRAS